MQLSLLFRRDHYNISTHFFVWNIRRVRQDWEAASRELGKLKDRHLEQAVKYSRSLEEQGKASSRERDLLRQVGLLGRSYRSSIIIDVQIWVCQLRSV